LTTFLTLSETGTTSAVTSTMSAFVPADLFPCVDAEDCLAYAQLCDSIRCGCVQAQCVQIIDTTTATSDATLTTEATSVVDVIPTTEATTTAEVTPEVTPTTETTSVAPTTTTSDPDPPQCPISDDCRALNDALHLLENFCTPEDCSCISQACAIYLSD
jgi:hypothetical protein